MVNPLFRIDRGGGRYLLSTERLYAVLFGFGIFAAAKALGESLLNTSAFPRAGKPADRRLCPGRMILDVLESFIHR